MSDNSQAYTINQEQRDLLLQTIASFQKQEVLLQQSLREQQTQAAATAEELLLELLEVSDALEALLDYLTSNPNPNPEFIQRLPRSLGAVHRKFLSVLAKRQVSPIELEGTQPDFNLCRVVDRELKPDLPDQTITKVIRRGFWLSEKILRPSEIITSKSS